MTDGICSFAAFCGLARQPADTHMHEDSLKTGHETPFDVTMEKSAKLFVQSPPTTALRPGCKVKLRRSLKSRLSLPPVCPTTDAAPITHQESSDIPCEHAEKYEQIEYPRLRRGFCAIQGSHRFTGQVDVLIDSLQKEKWALNAAA